MAEKKEAPKALGSADWEEEHAALAQAVKDAQKALWEHRNPPIEDPEVKAQQSFRSQQTEERKSLAKKAETK
jgi:hypothetical protein